MGTTVFTEEQQALMDKMDAAADLARTELAKLVVEHTEAVEALGKWGKAHYAKAGYKRLMKMIVALG